MPEYLIIHQRHPILQKFGIKQLTADELNKKGIDSKFRHTESGLDAEVFFDENSKQYTVAFRGTANDNDIPTDLGNGVAYVTNQYRDASELAKLVKETLGSEEGYTVQFTGHSLGGGLASLASSITGYRANTFNAAGVTKRVVEYLGGSKHYYDLHQLVNAYYLPGDIVSAIQDNTLAPNALGRRIELNGQYGRKWYNQRNTIQLHLNTTVWGSIYHIGTEGEN